MARFGFSRGTRWGDVMAAHVLETAAGVAPEGPLADALAFRARLMEMTQTSHDAALQPADCGGLSPELRAALACRITRIAGDAALGAHYAALAGSGPEAALCVLETAGATPTEAAILRYVDRVTRTPAAATAADIDALRDAGLAEADIVRLAGLVAFVNYQLRMAAVLRALEEAQ